MNESPDEAEIVEVYSAANTVEAHFLKNVLEEAGINARVVGDALLTGAGDLPLGKPIAPRVWVLEADAPRARQLMKDYEASHARPRPGEDVREETWTCPTCGEQVEADFDLCWNCQTPRKPY